MTAASSGFFDRVSELMESSSGKLFEFIVGSGVTVALVILIIFGIVRGVRALRRWQVSRLRYERSFSAPGVFEGDVCELYEKITNPTPLPMLFVDVETYVYGELAFHGYTGLRSGDMQYFISRFNLLPKKTVIRKRKLTAKKRGVYELGTASVTVGGEPVYLETKARLYVYPRITRTSDTVPPRNTLTGDVRSFYRLISDPFNVSGIRDMAPGDPFNSVNFNATARTGGQRIKVNERDFCSGRLFMIFLNAAQPTDPIRSERFAQIMESALSFSASVIKRALDTGYKAGFACNCAGEGPSPVLTLPSAGRQSLESVLRDMAAVRIYDCDISFSALLSRALPSVRDADVFIITAETLPEHGALIKQFKKQNNAVTVYNTGR